MRAYFDTSALVKLYYPEPESERLARWTQRHRPVLLWTPLHYSEMANAMSLKVFREEIDTETLTRWRTVIDGDVANGILSAAQPDWSSVFQLAREISFEQTTASGVRTLDVLHVASALALRSELFVTHDGRQYDVAVARGLKTEKVRELV